MFKNTSLLLVITIALSVISVNCAVIEADEIAEQGLYSKSDKVVILTQRNFDRKVYGQNHALVVQFYNSYCGHCRAFAPKFKSTASDLVHWRDLIQLAVLDCSIEENNEVCRQFEVMAYPSLRFLHENYVKGNSNVGERISAIESSEHLKEAIIHKLQSEQAIQRMQSVPPLGIASYQSYTSALSDVPNDVVYTFLVFENDNSTVGSELILDTHDYQRIRVKRVRDISELTAVANVKHFPGLVAVRNTLEATPLTPKNPTKANLLRAINIFLKSKNYEFPVHDVDEVITVTEHSGLPTINNDDIVYYSDLEKTLQMAFHNEVTRHKVLTNEPLTALRDFIQVILTSFPFQHGNTRDYFVELRGTLSRKNEWSGDELYELVKRLEVVHAPIYTTSPKADYIGCKGSRPHFRGYTCGLWTLFHTLTVNAAQQPGNESPKVLKAMHGYVKYFFGCTECAKHFQQMAARNRLFDVTENDKAVLWLWISHNEVNLRLAGDVTEDPAFPKLQFPSPERCGGCRLARGAWNLPAVLRYLQGMYGASAVRPASALRSRAAAPPLSPFSNLDIGMLSLLYIFSFIILILVVKLFLTKRFYRKRIYKHDGWGKV